MLGEALGYPALHEPPDVAAAHVLEGVILQALDDFRRLATFADLEFDLLATGAKQDEGSRYQNAGS